MRSRLEGKVALVTGASGGIGRAVSILFASEGARVVCTDIELGETAGVQPGTLIPSVPGINTPQTTGRSLAETVYQIQKAGNMAIGIQADISNEESCNHLLWNARRNFGNIDILVNDAAVTYFIPTAEIPLSWWSKCFAVNVQAPFMLAQKVMVNMLMRRSGSIINISSAASIGPGRGPYASKPSNTLIGGSTLYGVTKAAVERFTQGLAEELYSHGISVSCVAPSKTVDTPGTRFHKMVVDDNAAQCEPPEMMANAILLLATEPLDRVTGRVTYSQLILKEFGWIKEASGWGIDRPGSGFSNL